MIRIVTIVAPLPEDVDTLQLKSRLDDAKDHVARLHPSLRGMTVTTEDSTLTLRLRVAASDTWRCSARGRLIGEALLRRSGTTFAKATMTGVSRMDDGGKMPPRGVPPRSRKATYEDVAWENPL